MLAQKGQKRNRIDEVNCCPQMIKYKVDHFSGGLTWLGFHLAIYTDSMSKRKCGDSGCRGVFVELVKCQLRCSSKCLERKMLSSFLRNDIKVCDPIAADSSQEKDNNPMKAEVK